MSGWEVVGKMGMMSVVKDVWFIGFIVDYVIGVWMGYDDNMFLIGVMGGGLLVEIWK